MARSTEGASPRPGRLEASWLGRVPYLAGWRLQEAVAARVRDGSGPERLLLLEHDPVYTIGRSGSVANLLAAPDVLRAAHAAAYRVDRGGDITYHGPGQVVGYPILTLGHGPDLVAYVRAIEDALGAALRTYGIGSRAVAKRTGVWVDLPDGREAKIAAIGVRVSRGVASHGFALNVATDLAAFARMIPCGFAHEVASLERLGVRAPLAEVAARCAEALAERLGRELAWAESVPAPRDDEIGEHAPVRDARDLVAEAVAP